jgi:6-pyruvoyltetrahydropterin/6-carboxytetrahydropterin synthase
MKTEQHEGRSDVYRVTCQIDFCYGHRLLNYEGKCRHLHGHNGRAVISIASDQLDHRGMVLDFTDIKRDVSGWIDANLDHRMLLCQDDPAVEMLRQLDEPMYLLPANPTAESIAKLIFEAATEHGFPIESVKLWETPRCYATYAASDPRSLCGNSEAGKK